MKKLIFIGIISFLSISATSVAGQYFGLSAGTNQNEMTNGSHSPKMGLSAGVKYGYLFTSNIRGEVEVAYRVNHYKTNYDITDEDVVLSKRYSTLHSWAYMANVIYDIVQLNSYSLTPYVGAGIGYCQNTAKHKIKYDSTSHEEKEKDNRFAWQGIVGIKYPVSDTLTAGFEYHYFCGKNHAKEHSMGMTLARSF